MRTGAAGVIVGYGAHPGSTTHEVLGIEVPMATAIADAAAARRDYLDETGGRYVHLVAYGDVTTGGDAAKAIACGADAVDARRAAGRRRPRRPAPAGTGIPPSRTPSCRGPGCTGPADRLDGDAGDQPPALSEVLLGPTADASGARNIFGALRRAMAKCGYSSVKEFQKVELTVAG